MFWFSGRRRQIDSLRAELAEEKESFGRLWDARNAIRKELEQARAELAAQTEVATMTGQQADHLLEVIAKKNAEIEQLQKDHEIAIAAVRAQELEKFNQGSLNYQKEIERLKSQERFWKQWRSEMAEHAAKIREKATSHLDKLLFEFADEMKPK